VAFAPVANDGGQFFGVVLAFDLMLNFNVAAQLLQLMNVVFHQTGCEIGFEHGNLPDTMSSLALEQ